MRNIQITVFGLTRNEMQLSLTHQLYRYSKLTVTLIYNRDTFD